MGSPLAVLGLNDTEHLSYSALLRMTPSSVGELAVETGHRPATTARALRRLVELGLVRATGSRPGRYRSVDPRVAVSELIASQESALREARVSAAQLARIYEQGVAQREPDSLIEFVHGGPAILEREAQLERAAKTQLRALDMPPYHDVETVNPGELEFLGRGGQVRAIYATEGITARWPIFEAWVRAGEEARVLSTLPMKLAIYDDDRAMLPLRPTGVATPSPTYVVVQTSSMLTALIALFELLWDRALPVADAHSQSGAQALGLTQHQAALVGYLRTGMSDEAIARRLGISLRTFQRRLGLLMEQFGCRTRFQLALHLSREQLVS